MASAIIVPKGIGTSGRAPSTTEYVESFIRQMRAPLRERTVFTQAGRGVVRSAGERTIYDSKGRPIRVIELPEGGNIIQHGNDKGRGVEHQHVNVRPRTATRTGQVGRVGSSRQIIIPRR